MPGGAVIALSDNEEQKCFIKLRISNAAAVSHAWCNKWHGRTLINVKFMPKDNCITIIIVHYERIVWSQGRKSYRKLIRTDFNYFPLTTTIFYLTTSCRKRFVIVNSIMWSEFSFIFLKRSKGIKSNVGSRGQHLVTEAYLSARSRALLTQPPKRLFNFDRL